MKHREKRCKKSLNIYEEIIGITLSVIGIILLCVSFFDKLMRWKWNQRKKLQPSFKN